MTFGDVLDFRNVIEALCIDKFHFLQVLSRSGNLCVLEQIQSILQNVWQIMIQLPLILFHQAKFWGSLYIISWGRSISADQDGT